MPEFDVRASVQLHQEDWDALVAIAEAEERSVAYLIRKAIDEYLERHEEQAEGQT